MRVAFCACGPSEPIAFVSAASVGAKIVRPGAFLIWSNSGLTVVANMVNLASAATLARSPGGVNTVPTCKMLNWNTWST